MPLLAAFIGNLFAGALAQLGLFFTKRAAGAILTIGLAATAAAACWVAVSAAISGLLFAVPDIVAISATWIVPPHFDLCVKATLTTEAAVAAYRWTKSVALGAVSSAQ